MDLFEIGNVENEQSSKVLKKITLQNYRNHAFKEIHVGKDGVIFQGMNGVGKTNIIEAIYWVLSGRLFNGLSLGHLIGVTPENAEKGTKTSVKLEWENFSFEKIVYEKYREDLYEGIETSYYVNGALEKKNKQAELMLKTYLGLEDLENKFKGNKLKDLDLIALFFNIKYSKEVDYKLMRELITDMVGEVDFKTIINEKPDHYGRLVEPLKKHNLELETLKVALRSEKFGDKNKTALTDQKNATELYIKNLQEKLSKDLDEKVIKEAKEKIEEIDNEISKLKVKMTSSNEELTKDLELEISKQETLLEKETSKIKDDFSKETENFNSQFKETESIIEEKTKTLENMREQRSELNEKINTLLNDKSRNETTIENKKSTLKSVKSKIDELVLEWKQVKNSKNNENSDTITCPHCDKPFALHESKEHQDIQKNKLSVIEKKGKEQKLLREQLEEGISTIENEIEPINQEILKLSKEREQLDSNGKALYQEILELKETINETKQNAPKINLETETINNIKNQIETLKSKKNNLLEQSLEVREKMQEQISDLKSKKEPLEEITSSQQTRKNYEQDLQTQMKELSAINSRIIEIDELQTLIKELEKDMFTTLSNKVQNVFGENIKFQMFKYNTDGSIDTRICEMFVKDIEGRFVNIKNVNTGMFPIRATEFISKVKEHYNVPKSFLFIDEVGALDKKHRQDLLVFKEQVLATDVSDSEKLLEVKIGG